MKKTIAITFALSLPVFLAACSNVGTVQNKWCDPAQPEQITLSADALFAFDRSSMSDLLPEGRRTLDELAHKLTTGYATIDAINLTGHTDRLGNGDYNMRLGKARANTVRHYLIQRGVRAPILTATAGATKPITTSCNGDIPSAELKECLAPDRRVTVDILGARK
ncbi:OmpA family protein [Microvirga sp. W0021]|uniref:OmpA family protein n=1 Tax=Hohaiivirga grylli TaxID=3133970 RepID=A0ABV0BIJ0_9HYPH